MNKDFFHEPGGGESSPSALEHGLAASREIVREVQARRDRVVNLERDPLDALGGGKRPGGAALWRHPPVVALVSHTEIEGEPPADGPRVVEIGGGVAEVRQRYKRRVVDRD